MTLHVETPLRRRRVFDWGEGLWTARDLVAAARTPRTLDELRDEELARLPIIYQDSAKTQLH